MTKIGDYLKVFGNVASAIQAENASTHVSAVNDSDVVLYEKGYTLITCFCTIITSPFFIF